MAARKFWWPKAAYEARPSICLLLGATAAFASMRSAFYEHDQTLVTAAGLGVGSLLALYGGIIKQARNDYRASARRRAEAVANRQNRDLPAPGSSRPVIRRDPAGRGASAGVPASREVTGAGEVPAPPGEVRRRDFLPVDELQRRALKFVIVGCAFAGVALYVALACGELTIFTATGLVSGSLLTLYGALLQAFSEHDEDPDTDA